MNIIRQNDAALYCSKLPNGMYGPTIEKQKELLRRFCKFYKINITDEYIDLNYENKSDFYNMINDIKNKRFNMIISFDFATLISNEEELNTLLMELKKYDFELYLEDTIKYIPHRIPLFKLPRNDNYKKEQRELLEQKKKKRKNKYVPRFKDIELANPKTDEPIDWVEKYNEDDVRFECEPVYDNNGVYLGYKNVLYYHYKELVNCYVVSTKKKPKPTYKARRLF